jgi:hypothetical protein
VTSFDADRYLVDQLIKPLAAGDMPARDTERLIDRRLGVALAIGLDTLQNR